MKTQTMLDDKNDKNKTEHHSCQDDHLDANDALNCDIVSNDILQNIYCLHKTISHIALCTVWKLLSFKKIREIKWFSRVIMKYSHSQLSSHPSSHLKIPTKVEITKILTPSNYYFYKKLTPDLVHEFLIAIQKTCYDIVCTL